MIDRMLRQGGQLLRGAPLALLLFSTTACINAQSDRGVEALWHGVGPETFERGKTTRAQVLDALGPPSQILSLRDGTALYYMLESTRANGMILLVYNRREEVTRYDRAVFFFNDQDVLTDHAMSTKAD